jgi:hypothetical protein
MKIHSIESFRDGGTLHFNTDQQEFFMGNPFSSVSGKIFKTLPRRNEGIPATKSEELELIAALREMPDDEFYKKIALNRYEESIRHKST